MLELPIYIDRFGINLLLIYLTFTLVVKQTAKDQLMVKSSSIIMNPIEVNKAGIIR